MAADASSIRTVQTASVVLSTALAGGSAAVSAFVIPRLLESPTPLMLRQWGRMFDATKFVFPGGSVVAASAYLYLYLAPRLGGGGPAVVVSRVTGGSGWYLVAAALCAGFLPYTAVAVLPTNRVLAARVDEADRLALKDGVEEEVPSVATAVATAASEKKTQGGWGEDKTSKWLVDHWGIMSLPRAAMLGLAGVIGAWASL